MNLANNTCRNRPDVAFRQKTATEDEIRKHLQSCDFLFNPPLHNRVQIPAYSQKIAERATTFEAWSGEALVGLVAAYYNDQTSRRGFITSVSVLSDFQRYGVGGALIQRALDYGVAAGFKTVALEASVTNTTVIAFYQKHGFYVLRTDGGIVTLERDFSPFSDVV